MELSCCLFQFIFRLWISCGKGIVNSSKCIREEKTEGELFSALNSLLHEPKKL